MCTLNITLNDSLMDRIRPSFPLQQAIMAYAQKQLEEIFVRFAEQHAELEIPMMKPLSQLDPALQELCGICHVDENDLNGDGARKMMINYAAIPVMNASEYIATTNIE